MKKFKKNWIKMNGTTEDQVTEEIVETKEEKEMSFFSKHKKGLIIGGLGALAAGVAGLLIASKKDSDDEYEEDMDDDFVDEDIEQELDEEATEA